MGIESNLHCERSLYINLNLKLSVLAMVLLSRYATFLWTKKADFVKFFKNIKNTKFMNNVQYFKLFFEFQSIMIYAALRWSRKPTLWNVAYYLIFLIRIALLIICPLVLLHLQLDWQFVICYYKLLSSLVTFHNLHCRFLYCVFADISF